MKSGVKLLVAGLGVLMASMSVTALADGEANYKAGACFACHDMGIAGAPKLGDTENWAPRLEQGMDTLYKHAIEGFQGSVGYMPPRGGSSLDDDAIKEVVDYMASTAG